MKKEKELKTAIKKYNTHFMMACDVVNNETTNMVFSSTGDSEKKFVELASAMFVLMDYEESVENFIKLLAQHFNKAVTYSKTDGFLFGKEGNA